MKAANTKFHTIDDYIATFAPNVQQILEAIRQVIKQAAPEAEEAIKYHMPTFTFHGNLVHFAAFKNHIGFYGHTTATSEALHPALSAYETAKGSIKFPLDQPMPFDLIRRMIELRVQETLAKEKPQT